MEVEIYRENIIIKVIQYLSQDEISLYGVTTHSHQRSHFRIHTAGDDRGDSGCEQSKIVLEITTTRGCLTRKNRNCSYRGCSGCHHILLHAKMKVDLQKSILNPTPSEMP